MTIHFAEMTLAELKKLATELKIPGRSKMKKAQLVTALSATMNGQEDGTTDSVTPLPAPTRSASPTKAKASRAKAKAKAKNKTKVAVAVEAAEVEAAVPTAVLAKSAEPASVRPHPHAGKGPLLPPLELPPLPEHYDDAFLSILPQTPGSLVCLWSLSRTERHALYGRHIELRIVDQTWDHQVVHRACPGLDVTRWNVGGLTPGRVYRALLGTLDNDEFVSVLWSRPKALPLARPLEFRPEKVVWSGGVSPVPFDRITGAVGASDETGWTPSSLEMIR